jgi:putative endonuclease
MADIHDLGKEGEALALEHLTSKGYKIRERNWRSGSFEIDIIAEKASILVIVEVKTRSDNFLVDPGAAVTRQKQRSLVKAANAYVQRQGIDMECRFDIITVVNDKGNMLLDHIEDAFYPGL